jgi:hypothetical protein
MNRPVAAGRCTGLCCTIASPRWRPGWKPRFSNQGYHFWTGSVEIFESLVNSIVISSKLGGHSLVVMNWNTQNFSRR